ncbi:MAG: LPS translocon maturation chaperone LptM [Gammaproteobacteria bacterium]
MLHLKPYFFATFLVILLGSALLLTSCGQTGDLYLPGEETESEKEKSKN